ncbi:NUDIX hydrolase [Flavobacterium aquatile]|uniref:NUDIX hydrolase n=1 Tax=Flavobacterium aquatile LMG 4008 = ATCC 11947 TaxID=1453498 RepID=A0A095U247_9FLAO|nr:CoA pyrophosphatase [Flavobacterium aquatile]KGD68633.1 NUDIX hydrolase [Flavobacterium aquatile LMG 4008 = ATCC 11947]OXA66422.1 coenzyme A pyrophosphatase [Flavobacterium aquatile LMG 4008 = ATCC 11947]GEC79558.1 coenzyme A pyrophosphatase [Flavobacterium aquatile]
MNFNLFFNAIPNVMNVELPSISSHIKMAPLERVKMMEEDSYDISSVRKAAVMMLFYPKNDITHLLLIIRNSYPGVHSSQIAFPGGKVEDIDFDLKQTALRETHEEIGIHPNDIHVIRDFSSIYIPPSNFLVFPFLGISQSELTFTLQQEEVAGIIELPLSTLLDDSIISSKNLETSYSKLIDVPIFQIEEHSVWGATAMMLNELKDVLKMVL